MYIAVNPAKKNPKEKSITNYQKWIDNYFARHEKIEFTNQRQLTAFWDGLIGAKDAYFCN